MKFELKFYKFYKLKHLLKNNTLFFIYHANSLNTKNWNNLEQKLTNLNLKYYKIQNKLFAEILTKSILKNVATLINGPILIVYLKSNTMPQLTFKKLINLHASLKLLSFKLNNKFYLLPQLKNLKSLTYLQNIILFKNIIKSLNKIPLYKLKRLN